MQQESAFLAKAAARIRIFRQQQESAFLAKKIPGRNYCNITHLLFWIVIYFSRDVYDFS